MTVAENKYPEVDFDFETDLHIDKDALDEEIVGQANKMMRYSKAHAQAQLDRDRAKMNRDQVEARLDAQARREYESLGLPSSSRTGGPTEATITGWVRRHSDYIEAVERYNKAEYQVNILFGGVMAMNARRPLLEDLVRLWSQGYWSTPRAQADRPYGPRPNTQMDTEAAIIRSQEEAAMGSQSGVAADGSSTQAPPRSQSGPQPLSGKPMPRRPTPMPVAPRPKE